MNTQYKPDWTESPELTSFFSNRRCNPEDLYPSERRFLPWLAQNADRVLDAGCAAGGFYSIWRHYGNNIEYVGADISKPLIETAIKLHPGVKFVHVDFAEGTHFPDRFATVVAALGWMHWEPRYADALKELWRVAGHFLFFDVRLVEHEKDEQFGRQKLPFTRDWVGESATPYITVAWPRFAKMLLGLRPKTVLGYGYWGAPGDRVEGVLDRVCFATFVLEKEAPGQRTRITDVCLDLPLLFPERLKPKINLLSSVEFARLAPEK